MKTGSLEIDVHVTRPVEGRQPDIWLTTSLDRSRVRVVLGDITRPTIIALTPAEARELALLLNEAAEQTEQRD